eukprot:7013704-Prymnesium_polylepis.1
MQAALNIQKQARGRAGRKRAEEVRAALGGAKTVLEVKAVIRIQRRARGRAARRLYALLYAELAILRHQNRMAA